MPAWVLPASLSDFNDENVKINVFCAYVPRSRQPESIESFLFSRYNGEPNWNPNCLQSLSLSLSRCILNIFLAHFLLSSIFYIFFSHWIIFVHLDFNFSINFIRSAKTIHIDVIIFIHILIATIMTIVIIIIIITTIVIIINTSE